MFCPLFDNGNIYNFETKLQVIVGYIPLGRLYGFKAIILQIKVMYSGQICYVQKIIIQFIRPVLKF